MSSGTAAANPKRSLRARRPSARCQTSEGSVDAVVPSLVKDACARQGAARKSKLGLPCMFAVVSGAHPGNTAMSGLVLTLRIAPAHQICEGLYA